MPEQESCIMITANRKLQLAKEHLNSITKELESGMSYDWSTGGYVYMSDRDKAFKLKLAIYFQQAIIKIKYCS